MPNTPKNESKNKTWWGLEKVVTLPEANIAAARKLPQKESSRPTKNFQVLC